MAKATQKLVLPAVEQPQLEEPTTTNASTETNSTEDLPARPLETDDTLLAKEQSDFIDTFDLDEDNLGEDAFEEGQPVKAPSVKPAEAAPAAPAQTPAAPAQTAPAAPAKPGEPVAPSAAPAKPGDQTAQPAPAASAAAQPSQQQPGTEAGNEPATPAQLTNEEIQTRYKTWRGQTESLLATHHFALTEQEQNDLEVNPGEVIPKLMSKVYLDAVTATLSQVVNHLPQMIASVNENQTRRSSSEQEFYGRWPALKGHEDMVLRVGQVYRQLNPRASKEDFMNEVGAQTMVALRIPPESASPAPVVKPNGNAVAQQTARATPFVPAATAPGGGAPPQQPKNPFEQLAEDFAEEELDGD